MSEKQPINIINNSENTEEVIFIDDIVFKTSVTSGTKPSSKPRPKRKPRPRRPKSVNIVPLTEHISSVQITNTSYSEQVAAETLLLLQKPTLIDIPILTSEELHAGEGRFMDYMIALFEQPFSPFEPTNVEAVSLTRPHPYARISRDAPIEKLHHTLNFVYVLYSMREKSDEIIPGLWLGNAKNAEIMCDKVGAILNVNHINNRPTKPEHAHIKYFHLPIYDKEGQKIELYFDATYKYIEKNIARGIYIHCHAGTSRSATIVIAYLMRKRCISLKDAFHLVKSKRMCIAPNLDFIKSLQQYEITLGTTQLL